MQQNYFAFHDNFSSNLKGGEKIWDKNQNLQLETFWGSNTVNIVYAYFMP